MIPPIPKSLLPSTMKVQIPKDSTFGGEYEEPQVIGHVRYDLEATVSVRDYVLSEGSKGIIFVDVVNSDGAFEIPQGSLITIDGDELAAVKVTPYESFNGRVHHWIIEVA